MDSWELESAEKRHAAHPESFEIPPPGVRAGLRIGDSAKLLFRFAAGHVERMWVLVTEVAEGRYAGVLTHDAAAAGAPVRKGLELRFGPGHVADAAEPPIEWIEAEWGAELARVVRRARGLRE